MSASIMMMQGGAAAATVSPVVTAQQVSVNAFGGSPVTIGFRMTSAGLAESSLNGSTYSTEFTWCVPSTLCNLFEVRAVLTSSSTPTTGTMDSWLSMASTRTWTLDFVSGDTVYSYFTIGIRRASTSEIVAQFDVSLAAGIT